MIGFGEARRLMIRYRTDATSGMAVGTPVGKGG